MLTIPWIYDNMTCCIITIYHDVTVIMFSIKIVKATCLQTQTANMKTKNTHPNYSIVLTCTYFIFT